MTNLHSSRWHRDNPEKYAAHYAVQLAVKSGEQPPVSTLKCHGCDKAAEQYHHESYLPSDRLAVVPLCRGCHRRHHSGRDPLKFGVVATSVGLVRIAIASAQ